MHQLAPRRYGRRTAEKLLALAKESISSGVALSARSTSLRLLCDQLEHSQANLKRLQQEIEALLDHDPKVAGVLGIPEFGVMTVAVLRAELGDLDRFTRMDQVVAYVGLDLQVKQSGKYKGQTKLSKRGSGRVRRILYLAALRSIQLDDSPFGAYYRRLVHRVLMDNINDRWRRIILAAHLILTEQVYEPGKVAGLAKSHCQAGDPTPTPIQSVKTASGQCPDARGKRCVFAGYQDLVVAPIFYHLSAGLDKFYGFCSGNQVFRTFPQFFPQSIALFPH